MFIQPYITYIVNNMHIMSESGQSSVQTAVVDFYSDKFSYGEFQVFDFGSSRCIPAPPDMQKLVENIHEDVIKRSLGFDSPKTSALEGLRVLDLGCGQGRDVFIYSQLVGPKGHVIGIDITPNCINFLESMIDYHMKKFGYTRPNVQGLIASAEDLSAIEDDSVDVVMSTGLTCQVPDKNKTLMEIYRVLKVGGEFCIFDPLCSGEQFAELKSDKILWAEGYAGAFYWRNFIDTCQQVGFLIPLFVYMKPMNYKDEVVRSRFPKEEDYQNFKQLQWGDGLYRAFKVDATTSSPSSATYNGGIKYFEDEYQLDSNITFKKGSPVIVSAKITAVLQQSRFAPYFSIAPATVDMNTAESPVDPFEWMNKNWKTVT